MSNPLLTHTLGYPRIGARRELKKIVEAYWGGKISRPELENSARELRRQNWLAQRQAGIDLIPSNDFSFYDHVLDTSCLVGNVPARFGGASGNVDLETRFAIARGVRGDAKEGTSDHSPSCTCSAHGSRAAQPMPASEMTKWFDTNYHYIVPEFHADTEFSLSSTKPFDEFFEARELGIKTKPVLVGPVAYLSLGKVQDQTHAKFDRFELLDRLLPVYVEVLRRLADLGAEWVQIDEPVGTLDLNDAQRLALAKTYAKFARAEPRLKLMVATYFGGLRDNMRLFLQLPVAALHIDVTRAPRELDTILREFPADKVLSLGVVDGRNIWRNDFAATLPGLRKAVQILGPDRVMIAPSCSLLHSPVTVRNETKLDATIKSWLAFAEEKLSEVVALRNIIAGNAGSGIFEENQAIAMARRASDLIHRPEVKASLAGVTGAALTRSAPFSERQKEQRARFKLPLFPTTTIGSFPQTGEVRVARARWKKGEIDRAAYDAFLEKETAACVRFQDEIGLDVPVHGEFERTDMVEYFGEHLDGFVFTENGWVQSYGSRCVKPPVIYGDVSRPRPMTVRWSAYAQSLTSRPMKGMLTGPITILQWSFVRDDQPRRDTAWQIALALRDEVLDLERAGIGIIQIDEPALREGLPLRREDWTWYLGWAVDAFRLSAGGVRADTQIHTHMCYAEFNDIIDAIARLDADVITIETSRSNMELLEAFETFRYPNEIGPGVYDIHSPRVPSVGEMQRLMEKAMRVIPAENLWVNPDCGLKTRGWPEVKAALVNLVDAAQGLRNSVAVSSGH